MTGHEPDAEHGGVVVEEAPAPAEDAPRVPPVAVCVPLYQKEDFIAATLESILAQTFGDFELIVLDNACTDKSADIVRTFDDPRLRLEHNDTTISGLENFNKAVRLSRAPIVKVISADDLIHPQCLERQLEVITSDDSIALVSARQNMVDEHGAVISRDRSLRTRDLVGLQDRTTVLRRVVRHGGNPIGAWTNVLFRRSAFDAAGGADVTEHFFPSDVGIWLRILEHGRFYGIPETLCSFRINSGSNSAAAGAEGVAALHRFVENLCRDNPDEIRRSDRIYGALRAPVTRMRHQTLFAAAGPADSLRRRAALKIMSVGRRMSESGAGR